jgi:hypothetical protein
MSGLMRAISVAIAAVLVVVVVALVVAWLSPERASMLRPWWR